MSIIKYNGESKVIKRICELLDTMTGISFVVVQTLPTVDIQTNVIYLVPKTITEIDNIYDEYINTDGTSQGWELIGTTEIDLSNYYTKTEVDNLIPDELKDLSDDSTHRLVTDTEKSTWSGKANTSDIKDGTLTIQLNGENQQTFSANSSTNKTANIKAVDWVSNGKLGAKNLNSYPYYNTSRTESNVVWTDNGDGTVTANGQASSTANSNFACHSRVTTYANSLILPNGTYVLSGCPSGGSGSTYRIDAGYTKNGALANYGTDTGNGLTFTVNGDDNFDDKAYIQIVCVIYKGYNAQNIIFKPMVRLVEDSDTTYQPYAKTNLELTIDKHEQYLADVLGVKNLFPFPYYHPNYEESYVVRAVTYTQSNGVISVSGTCDNTGDSYCQVIRYVGQNPTPRYRTRIFRLKAGKYKLTGGVSSNVYLTLSYYTDTSSTNPTRTIVGNDYGDGVVFNVTEAQAETIYFTLFAMVKKGYQTQGETLKPMLRFANDTDESYMPFSLTNQELTEEVREKRLVNENLNDIINSGFYLGSNGNTVTNKPTGVAQFGLMVVKTGESGIYVKQSLTTYSGTEYVRYCSAGTWGNWTQL